MARGTGPVYGEPGNRNAPMAKPAEKSRDKTKVPRAQPYLAAALFCERVLEETDQVPTLVRLMDTIIVPKPPEPPPPSEGQEQQKFGIPILAFVAFKSGDAKGEYKFQIDMILPSGEREAMAKTTMSFLGDENGVNVKATVVAPIGQEGLVWYEVLVDGVSITRMPLRIRHAQPAQQTPSKSSTKRRKKG
jgi:hypothetical protein